MTRFTAVLAFAMALGFASPALAVDDALSIEANQKYLAENAAKKGVITRPSGLAHPPDEHRAEQRQQRKHNLAPDL